MLSDFEKRPFIDLSEKTIRIRRNLLAFSMLALIIGISGIKINSASFFGLEIENFSISNLRFVLTVIVVYFLVEFFLNAWDEVLKWRLKLTSSPFGRLDNISSADEDRKNRTIYAYLFEEKNEIKNIDKNEIENLKSKVDSFIGCFRRYEKLQMFRFWIVDTFLPVFFALISIIALYRQGIWSVIVKVF